MNYERPSDTSLKRKRDSSSASPPAKQPQETVTDDDGRVATLDNLDGLADSLGDTIVLRSKEEVDDDFVPERTVTPEPRPTTKAQVKSPKSIKSKVKSAKGKTKPNTDETSGHPKGPPEAKTTTRKPKTKRKKANPVVDPLYWQDFEITGDLPGQSDDDGEGLNGVGFEPPPERAYANRRERRAKIAEWKAGMAREARERRSNKRSIFGGDGAGAENVQQEQTSDNRELNSHAARKTVRFEAV